MSVRVVRFWKLISHFAEESIDIGKSQGLRKEGDARINKVLAMWPGSAKIIEKGCISRYFQSPDTGLHLAENACCIDYADSRLSKQVHWLLNSKSPHCGTTYYGWEDMAELNTGVACPGLPITTIHPQVAPKSQTQWLLATPHKTGWMDHCQVQHRSLQAIVLLDPVDVEVAYSDLASPCHSVQWHVRSMDRIMRASAMKKTQLKQDLFSAVQLAQQKLTKDYSQVTPMTGMRLISVNILDRFWKLWLFWKWDRGMDIHPEDETFYTTSYQEPFLKYVENEYHAKHRHMLVNTPESVWGNKLVPSARPSGSSQSSIDPYDLSGNDEEYLMPNNLAETTSGRSDCASRRLTAARLHLNQLSGAPKNRGQMITNVNDYHSNPMEISCVFVIQDITDWLSQPEEQHSRYCNLSNMAGNNFSTMTHGVWVEARLSLERDVINRRQSKMTHKTLRERAVVRQFARANDGILAGDDPALDTTNIANDLELKREVEERTLHRMAKVHEMLAMWQGSQNLGATQMLSCSRNEPMTPIRNISDTGAIVKASWSLFQHDAVATFKLSEGSPLSPALLSKDLPGEWTVIFNAR